MTTLWCEYAWLGGERPESDVVISVDGGRITDVGVGIATPPESMRLQGLTLPGFANTHSHAFHRGLRGRTHDGGGSFWTWREAMYRLAHTLDPDAYHELAKATFAEMLSAGFTVVGEFHYLHHDTDGRRYSDPNAMTEAVTSAAAAVGIRMTLLDTLYTHGGLSADDYLDVAQEQRRFAEQPDEWLLRHGALADSDLLRIGAAIHSVRAVDPKGISAVAEWAAMADAPLHAHVSEQPAENEQCKAVHGRTPTQLLADLGVLGDRFTAVHATHLTEDDIRLLGEAAATISLCPTTERDLADGVGPSVALQAAGARLTIGSDSNAVVDPFEETRAVELNQRLVSQRRGNHALTQLLEAATANGYRSLGWAEGGRIAPGALADLVTVGLDSVRLRGTEIDHMLGSVVFAARPEDVTMVMVAGVRR